MRKSVVSAVVAAALTAGLVPAFAAPAGAAPTATVAASTVMSARSVSSTPYLKWGSRGAAVKHVQAILGIKKTGVFDKRTVAAVKVFQKRHRIATTGAVGSKTWAALKRAEAVQRKQRAAQLAAFTKTRASLLHYVSAIRDAVEHPSGMKTRLDPVDRRVLQVRLAKVNARLAAVPRLMAAAATPGQAGAVMSTQVKQVRSALQVLSLQVDAMPAYRSAVMKAIYVEMLDAMRQDALEQGNTMDPVKEAELRARVVDAVGKWTVAAAPTIRAIVTLDPFSPKAMAASESYSARLEKLNSGPAMAAVNSAMSAYADLAFPVPVTAP